MLFLFWDLEIINGTKIAKKQRERKEPLYHSCDVNTWKLNNREKIKHIKIDAFIFAFQLLIVHWTISIQFDVVTVCFLLLLFIDLKFARLNTVQIRFGRRQQIVKVVGRDNHVQYTCYDVDSNLSETFTWKSRCQMTNQKFGGKNKCDSGKYSTNGWLSHTIPQNNGVNSIVSDIAYYTYLFI